MKRTIPVLIAILFIIILALPIKAGSFEAIAYEKSIQVITKQDKYSFVLRPVGTRAVKSDPDDADLPDSFQYITGEDEFSDLDIATKYYIDEYDNGKLISSHEVYTLASAPAEPADAIIFAGNLKNKIAIGLNPKDAENTLIIASRGRLGKEAIGKMNYSKVRELISRTGFTPGYGSSSAKLAHNTYIVHAGEYEAPSALEIDVPEFDEYTFAVVGYNGSGKTANFNRSPAMNAVRSKFPMMPPPKAVDPLEINLEDGYFMAGWKKLPLKANYIISVATDPAFENVLEEYADTDFGNTGQAPVMFEDYSRLYYRVRAVKGRAKSDWSNTIEVVIN